MIQERNLDIVNCPSNQPIKSESEQACNGEQTQNASRGGAV